MLQINVISSNVSCAMITNTLVTSSCIKSVSFSVAHSSQTLPTKDRPSIVRLLRVCQWHKDPSANQTLFQVDFCCPTSHLSIQSRQNVITVQGTKELVTNLLVLLM